MATAYITDSRFAIHTQQGHPEHAGRLTAIQERLQADGLLVRLALVDPAPATDEELSAVHTDRYLALLDKTSLSSGLTMLGADTYLTPHSYEIARLAAGSVLRTVDVVLKGEAANAMAAIRPPGHHATAGQGMGFCLLNNVAIAARYAQRIYAVTRVLIVDYDVHHGNGTQDIFYDDPSVLYISTHQSPLYPGTGSIMDVGSGAGQGYTLNIPLAPGVGDVGYRAVFEEIVVPAARRFEPDLILASVGFDAHWSDPLAQMRLSLTGYDQLTRMLFDLAEQLCEGRIVFVLEGGYNLDALSYGWANVAHVLLGDSAFDPLGPAYKSEPSIEALTERIKHIHKLV
jgi:acetoin utilization deacetylase AcuC-like enzyme